MPSTDKSCRVSRRRVIQTTAGASLLGIAGCTGGSGDTTPTSTPTESGDGGGGDGGDGGATKTTNQAGEVDISGVTFEFWETFNVQSRSAEEFLRNLVSEFEERTGATANMNWTGYGPVIGAEWINRFKNDDYPHMFTGVSNWSGRFIDGGWVVPLEEYRDELPDEMLAQYEWAEPLYNDYLDVMWGGQQTIPFALQLLGPFAARMDHFEEAGLDPSNDFPPQDIDHLIEVATTLQEQGPGEFGYQLINGSGDQIDAQQVPWILSRGGEEGTFLSRDRSEVLFDNEHWKTVMRKWVSIYREHGLSGPNTSQFNDEQIPAQMAAGRISMSNPESPNHPTFQEQVGEMYENGTIKWAPNMDLGSGQRGYFFPQCVALCKPGPNENQRDYRKRRKASIEMMKVFLSEDVQRQLHTVAGVLPARKDVWEDLPEPNHGAFSSWQSIAESTQVLHHNHPQYVELMYNIPGPYSTQAVTGEISAEEACDRMARDARELLGL